MPRTRAPYAAVFWEQLVDLVRSGLAPGVAGAGGTGTEASGVRMAGTRRMGNRDRRRERTVRAGSVERLKRPDISTDAAALCRIVVPYCRLPNPHVVKQLRGAVFPVVRDSGKRMQIGMENGRRVMYDDNTTPRWALLWSHGCGKTGHYPEGWTFAHVWNESKDPDSYTHVSNLVMMPECFASLSDKRGPLVPLLRHHAAAVYGWWPAGKDDSVGTPPPGYDGLKWNYLDSYADPRSFIQNQLHRLNNQRVESLRDLLFGSR